jgi:Fructose-bisphosphate aldolase class-II
MPVGDYKTYCKMLDRARAERFAFPAINVTSLTTANAVLHGFAESKSDVDHPDLYRRRRVCVGLVAQGHVGVWHDYRDLCRHLSDPGLLRFRTGLGRAQEKALSNRTRGSYTNGCTPL